MDFTLEAFRVPPPMNVPAMLFGQPEYTDWLDESMSWKRTCYIGDWSFLPQTHFRGPGVLDLFSDFSVNSFARFPIGSSKHVVHPNSEGKVVHEGILTRLGEEEYVCHAEAGLWVRFQLERGDYRATAEADDWFVFQVSGPTSLPLLLQMCGDDALLDVAYMHARPVTLAGHQVWALRQGMAGEVGFELQGPREIAKQVYDAIVEAGQKFGIRRLGSRTVPINHLENAVPTRSLDYVPAVFGPECADYVEQVMSPRMYRHPHPSIAGSFEGRSLDDYYRDPVELNWTRNIKFDHDFLGATPLRELVDRPVRTLRTLVWNSDDVVEIYRSFFREGPAHTFLDMPRDTRGFMWADQVERDGAPAGVSTSWGYSYYFRQVMSLAVMNVADAELGTEVQVVWGNPGDPQIRIRATVARAPYKPDNGRGDLRQHLASLGHQA
ncbi:aminomethyltransferase family protein [Actinoplanes subtropicus]|uniref:aminomethyltransferase family protein n=1 Tax=Actinoplanes subtropicus TaxID=543632 RepID=UPI000A794342|nr:aminomethyltransferase family protein [Actinoplanes subtropicus]